MLAKNRAAPTYLTTPIKPALYHVPLELQSQLCLATKKQESRLLVRVPLWPKEHPLVRQRDIFPHKDSSHEPTALKRVSSVSSFLRGFYPDILRLWITCACISIRVPRSPESTSVNLSR